MRSRQYTFRVVDYIDLKISQNFFLYNPETRQPLRQLRPTSFISGGSTFSVKRSQMFVTWWDSLEEIHYFGYIFNFFKRMKLHQLSTWDSFSSSEASLMKGLSSMRRLFVNLWHFLSTKTCLTPHRVLFFCDPRTCPLLTNELTIRQICQKASFWHVVEVLKPSLKMLEDSLDDSKLNFVHCDDLHVSSPFTLFVCVLLSNLNWVL